MQKWSHRVLVDRLAGRHAATDPSVTRLEVFFAIFVEHQFHPSDDVKDHSRRTLQDISPHHISLDRLIFPCFSQGLDSLTGPLFGLWPIRKVYLDCGCVSPPDEVSSNRTGASPNALTLDPALSTKLDSDHHALRAPSTPPLP